MAAIDDLLAKKPRTRSVTITIDPDSVPPVTRTLTFKAIDPEKWKQLIERHPATDAQQQEAVASQQARGIPPSKMQRLRWNADSFPPAAVAACSDELSVDDALLLWASESYNDDEKERIFAAVYAANESAEGTVAWGKGSGTTAGSGTS